MTSSFPIGLNYNVNKILDAYKASRAALSAPVEEADPYDKDPPRDADIRAYSQSTTDDVYDSLQTARNIGTLIRGESRLNIVSALTKNDLVDFYRFDVKTAGKLGISVTTDNSISIQLMRRDGTIIADSAVTNGEKADNWQKLGTGELDLTSGAYYLKITRESGVSRDLRPNYALQLSMSRYFTKDYDTVESPAAADVSVISSVATQNASALNSVLNSLGNGSLFDMLL